MPKLSSCSQASAHPIDTAYLESFNLNGQGKVANRNEMPTGTKTMNRTFWNKPHIRRWAIFALLPQGEIVNILLKIKNSFLPTKQILIGL